MTGCRVLGRDSQRTDGGCIGKQTGLLCAGHGMLKVQEGEKLLHCSDNGVECLEVDRREGDLKDCHQ